MPGQQASAQQAMPGCVGCLLLNLCHLFYPLSPPPPSAPYGTPQETSKVVTGCQGMLLAQLINCHQILCSRELSMMLLSRRGGLHHALPLILS